MRINWQATVVAIVASLVTGAWSEPAAKGADPNVPLVRVGVKSNQTPVTICGNVGQDDNGTLSVPAGRKKGTSLILAR